MTEEHAKRNAQAVSRTNQLGSTKFALMVQHVEIPTMGLAINTKKKRDTNVPGSVEVAMHHIVQKCYREILQQEQHSVKGKKCEKERDPTGNESAGCKMNNNKKSWFNNGGN